VKPGLDFVRDVLMPESRKFSAYSAFQRLKKKVHDGKIDIGFGDMYYLSTPKRMVGNAIKNADSYLKLVDSNKTNSGKISEKMAVMHEIKADIINEFTWVTSPFMEYCHDNDESKGKYDFIEYSTNQTDITFLPCLDDLSKRLVLLLGPNSDKQIFTLNATNILNRLRRDRFFPADIRSESIMELLVKPGVFGDEENMTDVLLTIGAQSELASSVAKEFAGHANRISIQNVVSSFSLADQFLPMLNIDNKWVNDCVGLNGVPVDSYDAYRLLVSLFIIIDGFQDGYYRKMRVNVGEGTYYNISKSLYGKNTHGIALSDKHYDPRAGITYIRGGDYF
jgi:hypothetical protein